MKRASAIGVSVMMIFFMLCGCFGYAAFGDLAPENLLAGFGFHQTSWVIDLANFFIVVHLLGAYQYLKVETQLPKSRGVSAAGVRAIETWASRRWPDSGFIMSEYSISIYSKRLTTMNLFRLTWRTLFVVMVTLVALALPFFTDMIALMGAIGYWPIVVYFPVEMHIAQNKIPKRTARWAGLQLLSFLIFLISLAAASGAIQGLHKNLHAYEPFKSKD
ncbi:hypothetical protein TIFTF001_009246 [Ficus carica]|uniref:Amino acid transporter transmembrane domain-containing protein n=1 Tax=Ficus carica TaxID=3494 RepID=A0AA87ZW64_FICCA|nr:hypothetical protein TIFTF001_009246 [Ficus carica]